MAKKIVLIVVGVVVMLIGLAVTSIGVAGLIFGGRSGVIQSGFHAVGTPSYALVSDAKHVRQGQGTELNTGKATLIVDGRSNGKPLFVGVGPAQQVATFLSGSSYETVTDVNFSPFRLTTQQVAGTARPARPNDQSFWVARATGTAPHVSWPIANGDYRLVVMNADASTGVNTDARVGLKIPGLFGTALGATLGGALFALLGLGLLIWGIAAKRKQPAIGGYGPQGPYGGYPTGTGYPTETGYPQPSTYPPESGYPPQSGSQPSEYPPQSGSQPSEYPPPAGYPSDATQSPTPSDPTAPDSGWSQTRRGTSEAPPADSDDDGRGSTPPPGVPPGS